jgi:hypothetical protein
LLRYRASASIGPIFWSEESGNLAVVSLPKSTATVTPAVETAGEQIASRM